MVTVAPLVLVVVRLASVLVALRITATSYRAYRRTGELTFRYAAVGFAFLSLGLAVESLLLRTLSLTLTEIHTMESLAFAIGFVALYASITGRSDR